MKIVTAELLYQPGWANWKISFWKRRTENGRYFSQQFDLPIFSGWRYILTVNGKDIKGRLYLVIFGVIGIKLPGYYPYVDWTKARSDYDYPDSILMKSNKIEIFQPLQILRKIK